jgi:S-DNA-T family DNA segregation ATPase FtsK/SpoIIIE
MMAALPRIDGGTDPADVAGGVEDLIDRVAAAWHGPRPPKLRLLPEQITTAEVVAQAPAEQRDTTFWIGVDEAELAPFGFSPAQEPHLFLYGDSQSGKSSFLRQVAAQIARVYPSNGAKIFAVDIRRSLLGELPAAHLGAYLTSHDTAAGGMTELAQYLRGRMPGPDVTPQQLRERSWWSGAEAFVLVDDYDLVATSEGNPLSALVPLLAQAHDIGLHLILTRRAGGASRASYDSVLQRLGDLGTTGILLSGDPEEGPLIGRVKAKRSVPGRAQIVSREAGVVVAQLAYEPPTQQ